MNRISAQATMHGAVSIVNAIGAGKGSALGISLQTVAEVAVEFGMGHSIRFLSGKTSDLLINAIVRKILPPRLLNEGAVTVRVTSEIPIGFGLKSSSAVSNAVALACSRLASDQTDDSAVLDAAVSASLEAKVSITGAYDDACACYYGGIVMTDNSKRELIHHSDGPDDLYAVILLPRKVRRGEVAKLKVFSDLFEVASDLAIGGEYWKAMRLNGTLVSAALSTDYSPTLRALEAGALSASVSGNGPSTAAIVDAQTLPAVKAALSEFDGRVITSKVNNQKASVELVDNG